MKEMQNYILTRNKVGNLFRGITGNGRISLNEGLIKTEPIEKLVRHAKEYCGFASSVSEYNKGGYQGVIGVVNGDNDTRCVKVVFPKSTYNETLIDNMFNTYGYFKSDTTELDKDFMSAEYESKYDEVFKEQLLKQKYLYHLTTEKKWEKIKERGIIVHNGKEGFNYPERSYFFVGLRPDEFLKQFFNEKVENNSKYEGGKFYSVSLALLKIDVTPIINKVKFYYDPNMDGGVYTEDYIPPQIIEIEKFIKYKILKKGNGEVIERK